MQQGVHQMVGALLHTGADPFRLTDEEFAMSHPAPETTQPTAFIPAARSASGAPVAPGHEFLLDAHLTIGSWYDEGPC